MNNPRYKLLTALLACLLLGLPLASQSGDQVPGWLAAKPRTPLWVVAQDARCWKFRVWVAESPAEFTRGLMFVEALPDDGGMLFGLVYEREISMWMRNTLIPLDILFADASGTIIRIHENAEPLSLDHIYSGQAVLAVLELPGGSTSALGIRAGDRLRHAHFGSSGCEPDPSLTRQRKESQ